MALYSAEGNKFHAGTGILVSRNFANKVIAKGVVVEGRAQFIDLEMDRQKIGILNVYAPNETGPRARFWESLADAQLPEADWLVAGDFNMTEDAEDRSVGYHHRNVGRRETAAWGRFTLQLGIHDIYYADEYRKLGNKRHTWRRERPQPTWSRLDRFYTNANLRRRGGKHGTWTHLSHLSDHAAFSSSR